MPCLTKTAAILTTLILLVALAVPAMAGNRSDAKLFAIAQAEQAGQDDAFAGVWALYQTAPSAAERSTALNDVEAAITESEKRIAALEVRPCFRPWHRAMTDLWALLAKAVIGIRTSVPLTPEEVSRGSALVALSRSGALQGYFHCTGGQ
jgi:hypothetical protein